MVKHKKNVYFFIPLALTVITLVGCSNEDKKEVLIQDNYKNVSKNLDSSIPEAKPIVVKKPILIKDNLEYSYHIIRSVAIYNKLVPEILNQLNNKYEDGSEERSQSIKNSWDLINLLNESYSYINNISILKIDEDEEELHKEINKLASTGNTFVNAYKAYANDYFFNETYKTRESTIVSLTDQFNKWSNAMLATLPLIKSNTDIKILEENAKEYMKESETTNMFTPSRDYGTLE